MTLSIENLELDDIQEEPLSNIINIKLNKPDTTPLSRNLIATEAITPDQAAKDRNLSDRTGIPTDIVSIDPKTTQRNADEQEMNALVKDSPGTLKFLSQIDNMAVSKDDYKNLTETENILVKGVKGAGKSFAKQTARTPFNLSSSIYQAVGMGAGLVENIERKLGDLLHTGSLEDTALGSPFKAIRDWALNQSKGMQEYRDTFDVLQLPEELRDKRLWGNLDLLLNPEWLIFNVGEAASSMAPMVLAAYATGGSTLVGGLVGGLQEAGSLYEDLMGQGIDQDRALAASLTFLPVVTGLNKIGLESILKSKGTGTVLNRLLNFGLGGAVEGTTEYLEEPFQAAAEAWAKELSIEESIAQIGESFKNIDVIPGAFLMGGGISAVAYQKEIRNNIIKSEQSELDQALFQALDTAVENSKTLERLPSAYKDFVNNVIEENEGSVESVFVDSELFQKAVEESQGLPEALDIEFDNTGGNIEIPIADYAAHIAGTDLSLKIREDVKFNENGYSIREAEAFRQELQEEIKQETQQSKETAKILEQTEKERQTIYDEVYQDRIKTGKVLKTASADAELWAAQVSTLAEDYNVSPLEMWRTVKPQIVVGDVQDRDALLQEDQTNTEAFKQWGGGNEIIEGYEINDATPDTGYIFKVYHGTTNDFNIFDPTKKGDKEGQFGAVNYFTSDAGDADINYAGMGSDLTNRIEQRKESIQWEIGNALEDGTNYKNVAKEWNISVDAIQGFGEEEIAEYIARKELTGDKPQTLELYVKANNPAYIGGSTETWIENYIEDFREDATEQILKENDADKSQVEEYEEEIQERIYEIQDSIEPEIYQALEKAIFDSGVDINASEIYQELEIYEPKITATELEKKLRENENLSYADDPETGELVSSHIIGEVFKNLGFDSIVLQNANERFANMDMGSETAHIHVFKETPSNIKLTSNLAPTTSPDIRYQKVEQSPTWYSALQKAIESLPQKQMPAKQWIQLLESNKLKQLGAKQEELEWTGVKEWLSGQKGKVTKQEVVDYIRENNVELEEVVLGDEISELDSVIKKEWKFKLNEEESDYAGSERFDVTNPDTNITFTGSMDDVTNYIIEENFDRSTTKFEPYQLPDGEEYFELVLTMPGQIEPYKPDTIHFTDAGGGTAIVWVRGSKRVVDSKKILHIEEIQSKRHQDGRKKGYKTEPLNTKELKSKYNKLPKDEGDWSMIVMQEAGVSESEIDLWWNNRMVGAVPDAPFKKSWSMLAMKRMVRYAAENGYDGIAITQGQDQADRYDLSKQVDDISWAKYTDDDVTLYFTKDGAEQNAGNYKLDELYDVVGKDLAAKIVSEFNAGERNGEYSGVDLQVGGEGMKAFYDRILPNEINKFFNKKKWGKAKVGEIEIEADGKKTLHYLPITPEMKSKALTEGMPMFQEIGGIKGSYTKSKNLISMFEKADESTFLHESGHAFFSFMGDMAMKDNAPDKLKKDWDIVLDYVGGKKGKALTTKQHETLAKTLEAYFMEGKAPSIRLANVFKSFKDWLLKIYQTVTNLGVKPTDEIRGVMDRMFASKKEIAEANLYYGAQKPFIQDLEKAEARTYNKLKAQAQTASEDKTFLKYVKAHIANLGGRDKLKQDAHKQISEQPVYKAMDTAVKEGGMPIAVVDTIIGKEARVALGKKRPSMLTKKGVLDPAKLAEENGFKSPSEMFTEMSKAERKRDAVETLYKQSIQEAEDTVRKGLSDDQAPAGSEEYHSDERMAVIQADIQLLQSRQRAKQNLAKGRLSARRAQIEKRAIRDIARQTLTGKTVKEAIRYTKFSTTEAKASKLAKQALQNNKLDQAEKYKRQELLNHALVLESIKLRDEVNKGKNYVKKQLNSKAINQEALDLITDISARFGLKAQPGKHADNVQAYIAWANQKNADGEPRKTIDFNVWEEIQIAKGYGVGLSDEVKDRSNSLEYKDLSIDEFRGVIESVKQIAKNDLLERQVTVAGKKVKLDTLVSQLIEQMGKTYDRKQRDHFNKTWKNPVQTIDARLLKMEQLFKALDGGELGIFYDALFQPLAEAEANENIMIVEANKTIKSLFDAQFSKIEQHKMFVSKIEVPAIGRHLTRSQLIRVGLDMGNEGNYQRRMVGEGWDHAQMLAVKDKLNKADWDFIQSVWDYINTFKEESFALETRMTGRTPTEIIPREIGTKYGTYKGGYFPVVIDPEFSSVAQSRLDKEQALLFKSGNYTHAMTKHSHLKERMQTAGGQALNLYLTDITQHVSGVIHDLTHREAVVDIAKVLNHPAFDVAMKEHIGVEASNQLKPWLKDIANPDPVISIGERWAKSVRIGVTVMYLGTVSVMSQQLAGFTQSIHMLGKDSWRLMPAITTNPIGLYKTITVKSKMMKTRISHYNREAHDAFKNVEIYKKLPAKIGQFAMNMIGVLQLLVDMPTWTAAYHKSMAKDGNETKAIQYADHTIRITQGSGGVKDLATVQRGNNYVRLVTMFYSFMNLAYNIFTAPMRGKHFNFTEMSSALLLVGLIGPMAAEILSGRPPEDDEEWDEWAAKIELRFFTGLLPVFRDVASVVTTPYGYQISPVGSSLNIMGKGLYYAGKNKDASKLVRPASEIGGMVFKMPTHLMMDFGETFWDWMSGEPDIEIQEFLYGRKR